MKRNFYLHILMSVIVTGSVALFATSALAKTDVSDMTPTSIDEDLDHILPPHKEPSPSTERPIFIGATMGATSSSSASGSSNRDVNFSYGIESTYIWHHWAIGPSFKYFGTAPDGSQLVNVGQDNYWGSLEAKFRIWDTNFSPYVSLGGGGIYQSVTTQVMGSSSNISGLFFSRDVGIGIMGRVTKVLGLSLATRYYQFSNVNGFDYTLSLGVFL